jgi:hypothetical protein
VSLVLPTRSHADLDYRDWSEGTLAMVAQSILYDQAKLYTLGDVTDPTALQVGMLISENPEVEDGGTRNVLMIECGMHAREWYAAESCYWFIDHLMRYRNTSEVRDLLSHVDLWILPQTNPAGRNLDDLRSGDPTLFVRYCNAGTRVGSTCSSSSDCPGGGCSSSGWRTNANTSSCGIGIDLARNFSSGWGSAQAVCDDKPLYRGPDPFSELETLNLRRFVHNHMISMALIVHANSQEISNQWYGLHQGTQFMTDELVAMNAAGSAWYVTRGYADPSMARTGVGGGWGQFSGWLTGASNVAGELDQGTERNISTFYFEVPIKGSLYGRPYQHRDGDGSNSFHPSSNRMESLWRNAIRDLLLYVTRQGRSPQCPVDAFGTRLVAQCENDDFGLVGAKISDATDLPGLLDYDASTREEKLPAGTHGVVFAVQNYGVGGVTSTNATVTVHRDGGVDATHVEPISLAEGERSTYSWDHSFVSGSEYRVTIELDADNFDRNNRKIFAFRGVPGYVTPSVHMGSARLRLQRRQTEDRLTLRSKFLLDGPLAPGTGGLALTLHGRVPHGSPNPGAPFAAQLPAGSPWWDGSRPEKGLWSYRDKEGLVGPVRAIKIRQRKNKKTGKLKTKMEMRVQDATLDSLGDARSYRADLHLLADELILTSVAKGRRVKVPAFQTPPEDGTEDEPDGQP